MNALSMTPEINVMGTVMLAVGKAGVKGREAKAFTEGGQPAIPRCIQTIRCLTSTHDDPD